MLFTFTEPRPLLRKLLRDVWCTAGDVQVTREQWVTSHKPGAVLASPSQHDPLSLELVMLLGNRSFVGGTKAEMQPRRPKELPSGN